MAIWVRPKNAPEEESFQVDIDNISAGGAHCLMPRPLGVGDLLEVDFELPQYTEIIRSEAVVRRQDGETDGFFLTGLEFTNVHNLEAEVLFQFLEDLLK